MQRRIQREALIRLLVLACSLFSGIGAIASVYIVLVRVPALANTRLEVMLGTLQGVGVGLLFAIAALLTNLTYLVWQAKRPSPLPLVDDISGVTP